MSGNLCRCGAYPNIVAAVRQVLDADIHTVRPNGTTRSIPFREFHRVPGDTPHVEVALEHGELITHVVIPYLPAARRSHYLKVRDRASYEFALASAAVVWISTATPFEPRGWGWAGSQPSHGAQSRPSRA